jgi:stage IV sporulation protein FB
VLIIRTKKFILGIDLLILLVVPVLIITGLAREFLFVFVSIAFHEFAHVAAASLMSFQVCSLNILPIGFSASIDFGPGKIIKRVFVYTAGPLINLIIVFILMYLGEYSNLTNSDAYKFLVSINIYLALFNMLPIMPLDGGKIANELIAGWIGFFRAAKLMKKVSFVLAMLLLVLGIIQLTGNRHNFSLLSIGLYILFLLRSKEGSEAIMNLKHIFYRRSRLIKKGLYSARTIVAMENTSLGEVIKNLDFDRFHLVNILDSDLKIIKVMTEEEIINAMILYGTDLTLTEVISKNSFQEFE